MRKVVAVELAIVFAILIAVFLLVFLFNGVTVEAQNQPIGIDTASKSIVFDLKAGQHVSGSLNYTGDDNGSWFAIYDPNYDILNSEPTSYSRGNHSGSFSFTATMDGKYYLGIGKYSFGTNYIDYQYTVSPAFLGLDKTALLIIVLAVGGSLATLTALNYRRKLKNRKTTE